MAAEVRNGVAQSEGRQNGDSFRRALCIAKTGGIFTLGRFNATPLFLILIGFVVLVMSVAAVGHSTGVVS